MYKYLSTEGEKMYFYNTWMYNTNLQTEVFYTLFTFITASFKFCLIDLLLYNRLYDIREWTVKPAPIENRNTNEG